MMKGAISGRYPAETVRSNFNDLNIVEMRVAKDHTHGESAADRSGASNFMDRLGLILGLDTYFIQKSRADERNDRDGSRIYYWVKDLTSTAASFVGKIGNRLVCIVDVDQYLDMPSFLAWFFQPVILYTFQPEQVARVAKEYSYTFDQLDTVTYYVTGGATYKHQVWSYNSDSIRVDYKKFGITWVTATYLIDRRRTSDDHELILLTPLYRFFFPFTILTGCLSGSVLRRLRVAHGEFLRLETHSQKGVFTSTGRPGCFYNATIPTVTDETLSAITRTCKYDLTMPQVLSHVDGDREKGAVLLEFHRSGSTVRPDVIFPVPDSIRRYQFEPVSYDPSAKPGLTPFMSPFLHECFSPDQTLGNERQCVRGRVNNIKHPEELKSSPFLSKVMVEFVEQFLPIPHLLDPVDAEYVYEQQNRPSQRKILEETGYFGAAYKRVCQMFIKKEAYANPNDPRPISTINGCDKEKYSRYIYALAEYIKTQSWYAFGKKPIDIARRVALVCAWAMSIILSDFSRFDGRVSNLLREFERLVFMRAFRRQHHKELLDIHRSQFGLNAFGMLGTFYETDFIRLSGSPETAGMNSLANAFVAFLAFRMTTINGGFYDAVAAYKALGIYGGDDGLTPDMDPKIYQRAAEMVGQKLTVDVIKRGELGVKFLARCYGPDIWFGDLNSCCDLKRQLSKFHATVSLPPNVTPSIKLIEKCRAFILTDLATPIIGNYCCMVLCVFNTVQGQHTDHLQIWGAEVSREFQYPNEPCDWYNTVLFEQMPAIEYARFCAWMVRVHTLFQNDELLPCGLTRSQCMIMQPPLLCEPTPPSLPKYSVVCDDELYIAEDDDPFVEIALPLRPNKAQRKNIRSGKRKVNGR
jgi:hypothetical protein